MQAAIALSQTATKAVEPVAQPDPAVPVNAPESSNAMVLFMALSCINGGIHLGRVMLNDILSAGERLSYGSIALFLFGVGLFGSVLSMQEAVLDFAVGLALNAAFNAVVKCLVPSDDREPVGLP